MWIRVDDTVEILTGEDRGTRGKVLRVERNAGKAVVEHVNRVYKHVRRSQRNPQGGRLSMEMPIQLSNVALVCESCGAAARVGARYLDDGSKERFCKKCGAGNGQIAPAKAQHARKES
ncbi:MAG TPA: 50S ribosomal protein L24 [Thermoguttaceae bacterium]|nr:50S ribosomal protein L24 [Thermoguttaceae bacterium]